MRSRPSLITLHETDLDMGLIDVVEVRACGRTIYETLTRKLVYLKSNQAQVSRIGVFLNLTEPIS